MILKDIISLKNRKNVSVVEEKKSIVCTENRERANFETESYSQCQVKTNRDLYELQS